jgi:hypothetical protein
MSHLVLAMDPGKVATCCGARAVREASQTFSCFVAKDGFSYESGYGLAMNSVLLATLALRCEAADRLPMRILSSD